MAKRHAFPLLDAMRGVAALIVLTRHVPDVTLKTYFPGGYLAVDFFFALSGFVLAHAYEDRLRRGFSPLKFMALRYVRILPQYLIAQMLGGSLIAVSLVLGHSEVTLSQWFAACFFAAAALPLPPHFWSSGNALFPLDLPAWSLFFELAVNVAYCAGIFRFRGPALVVLLMLAGTSLVGLAAMYGNLDGGGDWSSFPLGIGRVVFSFFAGVAVLRLRKLYRFAPELPSALPLLVLLCLLAWPVAARASADLVAVALFPILLLVGSARARCGRSLGFLGRISYGVYVLQYPIIGTVDVTLRKCSGLTLASFGIGGTVAVALAVIAVAALIEYRVDGPLRAGLKRRFCLE